MCRRRVCRQCSEYSGLGSFSTKKISVLQTDAENVVLKMCGIEAHNSHITLGQKGHQCMP